MGCYKKGWISLLLSVDKRLLLLLGIALIVVGVYLANMPELFPGGGRIGSIIYALSLAYISSFIFFFVVVHIKRMEDKAHIDPHIAFLTRQIFTGIRVIILEISRAAGGDTAKKYPSRIELDEVCKRISAHGTGPKEYIYLGVSTWMDFIDYWKKRIIDELISDLLRHSRFLEAEHIELVERIEKTGFFYFFERSRKIAESHEVTVIFPSESLYELSESAKALEEYYGRNFPAQ
jgi:hypothetical protein